MKTSMLGILLVTILGLCCCTTSNDVVNPNFPVADTWIVEADYMSSDGEPTWKEHVYRLGADTTIEGNVYHPIFRGVKYYGSIRYTNKFEKLFYHNGEKEYLLCDFTMKKNQRCEIYIGRSTSPKELNYLQSTLGGLTVPGKVLENKVIDGRHHVKIQFLSEEFESYGPITMIQGIGSHSVVFSLAYPYEMDGAPGEFTRYAQKDDKTIYTFDLSAVGYQK